MKVFLALTYQSQYKKEEVLVEQRHDQQMVNATRALPMSFICSWDSGAFVTLRIVIFTISFEAEMLLLQIVSKSIHGSLQHLQDEEREKDL